jgi:hypothetical protein
MNRKEIMAKLQKIIIKGNIEALKMAAKEANGCEFIFNKILQRGYKT